MAGTLVVGQSGGVTPVLNSSLAGVIRAAAASGRVDRVLGMRHGVRGLIERNLVPLDGLSDEFLARLAGTPGAWLGSCRYAPSDEELDGMLACLAEQDVRYYIYAGGNDSAATSALLAARAAERGYDLHVINVPKTIDNDLPEMDHCPGYPTAAAYVALCTQLLCLDTRAMLREEPVRVIEVKGRHGGWLAASAAGFAQPGGDEPLFVYVPEQPLEDAAVLADVERGLRRSGWAVLAVSEHAVDAGGRQVGEGVNVGRDAFGHDDSHGPGAYLKSLIETELGRRCRLELLGAMQKVALLPACELDRREAFAAGEFAVRAALAGENGRCVALNREAGDGYRACFGLAGLDRIAGAERLLPPHFIAERSPTAAFRDWLRPLVAEVAPMIERLAPLAHGE